MLESVAAPLNFQRNRASLPLLLGGKERHAQFPIKTNRIAFTFRRNSVWAGAA